MSNNKLIDKVCAWDESHKYQVLETESYKALCPKCYFNIYVNHYSRTYQWYDFIKNVKLIKIKHQLQEMIEEGSDFKVNFDFITQRIKSVKKTCFMDEKEFFVYEDEEYRNLCNDCYKKYYLPLKEYFSVKQIEKILTGIKNEGGDIDADFEEVLKNAKEDCK